MMWTDYVAMCYQQFAGSIMEATIVSIGNLETLLR